MPKCNSLRFVALLCLLAVGTVTIKAIGEIVPVQSHALWRTLAALPAEAAGTIIYVDATATGAGTGASWADAKTKLQAAFEPALSGDQIWVAAGVYYPDEGGPPDNDPYTTFTLKNGVAVYGGFAGTESALGERDWIANVTVLSGDLEQNDTTDTNGVVTDVGDIAGGNAHHVVTGGGTNSSAVLDGFTITAGRANGLNQYNYGAGMFNENSSPTLTNLNFSGNWAEYDGGGIRNYQSSPTLTKVSFSGNQALGGGGMYNYASSSPTLTDVSFTGNQATGDGGGMGSSSNSSPTLTNVSFTGNQALGSGTGVGGGMYSYGGNPTLTNVSFSGNQAMGGGGMYNDSNSTLTNVSFSGNLADYGGGMVNVDSPSLAFLNVTFSGNRATTSGGGMWNNNSGGIFLHIIMWNNSGGSINNIGSSLTITIAYSVIEGCGGSGFATWHPAVGVDGGNNLDVDPLFVTPVDPATAPTTAGDLRLQGGSPGVDTGYNPYCPPTDLDGFSRPIDGDLDGSAVCDMGAYEKTIDLFLPLIMR